MPLQLGDFTAHEGATVTAEEHQRFGLRGLVSAVFPRKHGDESAGG